MAAGQTSHPDTILVFRALQLGDMLCAVPALRALREAHPRAKITLVGLPWARAFSAHYRGYIDDFIEFPGYPGLPERACDAARVPAFFAATQARRFDLVVQLHGSGLVSNPLCALLGGRQLAGFYRPGCFCPDPTRFLAYPVDGREVRRLLALTYFLGCPDVGEQLEFTVTNADEEMLVRALGAPRWLDGDFVCLHPGARQAEKRWPSANFALVADALAADGLQVVLTGSAAECGLTQAVCRAARAPLIDTAALDLPLGALAALLSRARLLVSNDTGVSHLASALELPSVILFLATDPGRWAPLDSERHRALTGELALSSGCVIAVARSALAGERGSGGFVSSPKVHKNYGHEPCIPQ